MADRSQRFGPGEVSHDRHNGIVPFEFSKGAEILL